MKYCNAWGQLISVPKISTENDGNMAENSEMHYFRELLYKRTIKLN